MSIFYCYDGNGWLEAKAANMDTAERKNSPCSWLTTDINPVALEIQVVDEEEYIEYQYMAVCRCKLKSKESYTVVLGEKAIKCENLIFSRQDGNDKNGYRYIEFLKKGHPVWVYLGNPQLLIVPASP